MRRAAAVTSVSVSVAWLGLAIAGCGSSSGTTPEVKDNGTCTFSGARNESHTCTVAGAYTTEEQAGVIEITYNLSTGTVDAGPAGITLFGDIVFFSEPTSGTFTSGNGSLRGDTTVEVYESSTGTLWQPGTFTLVLSSVQYLGVDPEIGKVDRPYGTFDATLDQATGPGSAALQVHATF